MMDSTTLPSAPEHVQEVLDHIAKLEDEQVDEIRHALNDWAGLYGPHYLVLGPDRFTIEHSLACRESGKMATCKVHRRVADWLATGPIIAEGRYEVKDDRPGVEIIRVRADHG